MIFLLLIVSFSTEDGDIYMGKQNETYSLGNFISSVEPRLHKVSIFPVLKVIGIF